MTTATPAIAYDLTGNGQRHPASASHATGADHTAEHGHYFETDVKVYLRNNADNTGWLIDSASLSTGTLDSSNGVEGSECTCVEYTETASDEHIAAEAKAQLLDLPDAEQLLHLLADALGYTVQPGDRA